MKQRKTTWYEVNYAIPDGSGHTGKDTFPTLKEALAPPGFPWWRKDDTEIQITKVVQVETRTRLPKRKR